MPAQHLPAPAAVHTDHVIVVNGSSDRNCGGSRSLGFYRRFTKTGERMMYSRDQGRKLIRLDLIASNIGGDDLRGEFGRLCIRHRVGPLVF